MSIGGTPNVRPQGRNPDIEETILQAQTIPSDDDTVSSAASGSPTPPRPRLPGVNGTAVGCLIGVALAICVAVAVFSQVNFGNASPSSGSGTNSANINTGNQNTGSQNVATDTPYPIATDTPQPPATPSETPVSLPAPIALQDVRGSFNTVYGNTWINSDTFDGYAQILVYPPYFIDPTQNVLFGNAFEDACVLWNMTPNGSSNPQLNIIFLRFDYLSGLSNGTGTPAWSFDGPGNIKAVNDMCPQTDTVVSTPMWG